MIPADPNPLVLRCRLMRFVRHTFMMIILLGGCTRPSVVEVGPTLAPFRETIAQNATSAIVLDEFSWALSDVDQVWRVAGHER